ncbi:MAG: HepT-like ribonuclease domain-containing protein [Xanthobacteraceae bacterium]
MPSTRSEPPLDALIDILRNIDLARSFVEGFTLAEFRKDIRTVYAATRCLEVISEASRRLPKDMKLRHQDIPWSDIAGAGNIYRHDYEDVLEEIIWHTIHNALGPLRAAVEGELATLDKSG